LFDDLIAERLTSAELTATFKARSAEVVQINFRACSATSLRRSRGYVSEIRSIRVAGRSNRSCSLFWSD
jgi:hypothetical protein